MDLTICKVKPQTKGRKNLSAIQWMADTRINDQATCEAFGSHYSPDMYMCVLCVY